MGKPNAQCTDVAGQQWKPAVGASLIMAVRGSRRVWASIPYAPGAELRFKLITAPANVDPNTALGAPGIRSSNLQWGQP